MTLVQSHQKTWNSCYLLILSFCLFTLFLSLSLSLAHVCSQGDPKELYTNFFHTCPRSSYIWLSFFFFFLIFEAHLFARSPLISHIKGFSTLALDPRSAMFLIIVLLQERSRREKVGFLAKENKDKKAKKRQRKMPLLIGV